MMVKLKDYKLRSSGNSIGQMLAIPISIIREWDSKEGIVEIYKNEEGDIIIRPKKYNIVSP